MAAGCFSRQNGRLRYEPSGREPIIIAGSGRGFPSHPRGINQKATGKPISLFLTETYLAECRKRTGYRRRVFGYLKRSGICVLHLLNRRKISASF